MKLSNKISALRKAKLKSIQKKRTRAELPGRSSEAEKIRSLVSVLSNKSKLILIGEIHQRAKYNGTGFAMPIQKIAKLYERYCDAIVIVTDDIIFDGKSEWISEVRKVSAKPLIALDIFMDQWQIRQAKILGADAIILIAGILNSDELFALNKIAKELELEVIIEVQNEFELDRVIDLNPDILGINTRDLENLSLVDLTRVIRIAPLAPSNIPIIAESGIRTDCDIDLIKNFCNAVLIGSAILESDSTSDSLKYLRNHVDRFCRK